MNIKLKLSTGKEIELTENELGEFRAFFNGTIIPRYWWNDGYYQWPQVTYNESAKTPCSCCQSVHMIS